MGEDLVECLTKAVYIKKPINDATSNNYFTVENVGKCMGHIHLRARDFSVTFMDLEIFPSNVGQGDSI